MCRQVTQPSSLRDIEWSTMTCSLNFTTIGIWPEGADGTDVNACSRSHSGQLIATADDFGRVKLYNYPASQPKVRHCLGNVCFCLSLTPLSFFPSTVFMPFICRTQQPRDWCVLPTRRYACHILRRERFVHHPMGRTVIYVPMPPNL